MAKSQVYDGENLEKAISRFKKMVEKEGIVKEYKKRQYFQKPSALKHIQKISNHRKELKNLKKLDKNKKY